MPTERLSEHTGTLYSYPLWLPSRKPSKAFDGTTSMKVQLKKLEGSWDAGYALNKHTLSSDFIGYNEFGHPMFDTKRSEPGEALYQLKYRSDWTQVEPLAAQIKA
jgi:hypothetical protein